MGGHPGLQVEFCGEILDVHWDSGLVVGREADLVIDDNPYLHRRFLSFEHAHELWWVANVGAQLSATVSDVDRRVQAWLAPGARLPLLFERTLIRFGAGATSYEFSALLQTAPFSGATPTSESSGTTTLGANVVLTPDQKLLVVALAEHALREPTGGRVILPSSEQAAERLGWTITKFNRKLDNVCQKLKRAGVQGLHGDADKLAGNRRARLVEYALATCLITDGDLESLPPD